MATTMDDQRYVLTVPAVIAAIHRLSQRKSHEHFPGYLLLHHLGVAQKVHVDSAALNQARLSYLRVGGAPDKRPFIQAFRSRGRGPKLDNANSAGSYGAESIRSGQTLAKVVGTAKSRRTASGITYRFKPNHASVALSAMLDGRRLPAGATAAFLLRDYAFAIDPQNPGELVAAFKEWLRMDGNAAGQGTFDTLFEDDSAEYGADDFEPVGA